MILFPDVFTGCPERTADFYIRVGQTFNQGSFDPTAYTLCYYQPTALVAGETKMFHCPAPIEGRLVTVHFSANKTEYLTLCEVEVFGYIGMYWHTKYMTRNPLGLWHSCQQGNYPSE